MSEETDPATRISRLASQEVMALASVGRLMMELEQAKQILSEIRAQKTGVELHMKAMGAASTKSATEENESS